MTTKSIKVNITTDQGELLDWLEFTLEPHQVENTAFTDFLWDVRNVVQKAAVDYFDIQIPMELSDLKSGDKIQIKDNRGYWFTGKGYTSGQTKATVFVYERHHTTKFGDIYIIATNKYGEYTFPLRFHKMYMAT